MIDELSASAVDAVALSNVEITKRLREKWRGLTRVQRNAFYEEAEKVEK